MKTMAVYSFGLCSQKLESSMRDATVSGKAAKLIAAHPHATIILTSKPRN
jgi:hypothetical protein